jgi:hypothetical protein
MFINWLLRPRIWPSFSPSCRLYEQEAARPRVLVPATYHSGMPRVQHPAVARWHAHLRDLVTPLHETSGLGTIPKCPVFFGEAMVRQIVCSYPVLPLFQMKTRKPLSHWLPLSAHWPCPGRRKRAQTRGACLFGS